MATEWSDVVLPIFKEPEKKPERVKSAKEEDKEAQIRYRRFKSSQSVHCEDCIENITKNKVLKYPHQAAWKRMHKGQERLLCQFHKIEQETIDGV